MFKYSKSVAPCAPLSGKPFIVSPSVFGASPGKPFLMRAAVLGERPMKITFSGLPKTLRDNGDGTVSGTSPKSEREYNLTVTAVNALGSDSKSVTLSIRRDGLLRTPLLGFTSWNAFREDVSQKDIEQTARLLVSSGLADCGYTYVNIDSGWQGEYGGSFDAIMPNPKFPDMKGMCDRIHALGLKVGIYSTPMLTAWGCPKELESIPGCTRGRPDPRFGPVNGGIGVEHMERNNVLQWCEWGFDYLKYDYSPCDTVNVDIMKRQLRACRRDFAMCVTVNAIPEFAFYWKTHLNSWRNNGDTNGKWESCLDQMNRYDVWIKHTGYGHFYDMDMLDIGRDMNEITCVMNADERRLSFSSRAVFMSPIQLSSKLDAMDAEELSLYANEEVLDISQDVLAVPPQLIGGDVGLKIYLRPLADGSSALAVFNLSDGERSFEVPLGAEKLLRDVWTKNDIEVCDTARGVLPAHAAALLRLYEPCEAQSRRLR